MHTMRRIARLAATLAVLALALVAASPVLAAEVGSGDSYRLEAGQVIADDLYVTGQSIVIAGTVEGDLFAAGGSVEISGTVTGDANVAGASIYVSGTVEDDLRAAGAGLDVTGNVGGDLLATGGGGGFAMPFSVNGRNVEQGVRLSDSAQIGGDALVSGGRGTIAGNIGEELRATMGELIMAAHVGGDAQLAGGTIVVEDPTQVDGVLRYSTDEPLNLPDTVAADVVYVAPPADAAPTFAEQLRDWLIRTVLILLGFLLLGFLLLRFRPSALTRPARAIATEPGRAGLFGGLAMIGMMILPLASALLVFLMIVFWGVWPGIVLGLALFGVLALLWFLSPLITGVWLGQWLSSAAGRAADSRLAVLGGVLLLALLTRIPYVGWLFALLSFVFALGGLFLARRQARPVAPAEL